MDFSRFCIALICGSLPLGFAFAAIGAAGHESPALAIALSAIVPAILWMIVRPLLARHSTKEG